MNKAKKTVLVLPLACFRVGDPSSGKSFNLLIERVPVSMCKRIACLLNSGFCCLQKRAMHPGSLARELLSFANSDRERECIRYAIFKSSGLTATQARCFYGFKYECESNEG